MISAAADTRTPSRRGLVQALDHAASSHRRAAMLLIALSLAMFLPGFFQLPPIDRDEARFAQASKQMVETGEYVDIRFQNEVRYKKPVGIYWLQAGAVKAADAAGISNAHTTIWLYRLPSLLGAIGAVLLSYWAALALVSRRAAVVAAAMMACCVLLGVESKLAKTDAVLLMTSTAALGAMARVYLTVRRTPGVAVGWAAPAIFWTALAGGTLVKGPLVFMFVTLAALVLCVTDRSARWLLSLRFVPGLIWFCLLVLPWFVMIMGRAGSNFIAGSVGNDLLPKLISSQEGHGAPPGFYFLLFWVTFWPGSVLAGLAAPMVWRARREPGAKFLLAWLVPSWIVLELVVTKLPHYVLPLYPAVAILIAGILERGALSQSRLLSHGTIGWFLFPLIISVVGIVGSVYLTRDLGLIAWPFAAAAIVMGLFAWWLYDADGPEHALLRGFASAFLVAVTVYTIILPSLTPLFPSVMLADAMRQSGCKQPAAAAAGFHEPSLVFLAGTETRLTDGGGAAEFLRQGPCRFAFIEARSERSFVKRAEALGLRYRPLPRVEGFNISNGRPAVISIFRTGPEQP